MTATPQIISEQRTVGTNKPTGDRHKAGSVANVLVVATYPDDCNTTKIYQNGAQYVIISPQAKYTRLDLWHLCWWWHQAWIHVTSVMHIAMAMG